MKLRSPYFGAVHCSLSMQLLHVTILLFSVVISTLANQPYYAIPIQQYIVGDEYNPYENSQENEVLVPGESAYPQFAATSAESEDSNNQDSAEYYAGSSSDQDTQSDDALSVNPLSSNQSGKGADELLVTDEANNYYRPYVRFRQISRRRTRVPISRRSGSFSGYPLSGYANDRDRFPTVA